MIETTDCSLATGLEGEEEIVYILHYPLYETGAEKVNLVLESIYFVSITYMQSCTDKKSYTIMD